MEHPPMDNAFTTDHAKWRLDRLIHWPPQSIQPRLDQRNAAGQLFLVVTHAMEMIQVFHICSSGKETHHGCRKGREW